MYIAILIYKMAFFMERRVKKLINEKIIAVVNQKGGVGKTTIVFNLGVALANKILLIDTDSQANLTTYIGWYKLDVLKLTLSNLMKQIIND